MITRKAITDACTRVTKFTEGVPDEVIIYMRDAAIAKLERSFKPTTVEDMENSAHSFTEGMETKSEKDEDFNLAAGLLVVTPTIKDQIEFMETVKNNLVVPFKFKEEISAIINNLRLTQVFEHQRMLIQNINFEGLIEKLIRVLKTANRSDLPGYEDAVANAEAALGMIDAFKQKKDDYRDHMRVGPPITAKDVADAHHAGKNILDRKSWSEYPYMMQQKKRDELVDQIRDQLEMPQGGAPSRFKIANAIIFAIEEMDRLKKSNGAGSTIICESWNTWRNNSSVPC